MKKQNIVIGVAPTKRSFLSMEEAKRQKEKFMAVIRGIHPDVVTLVDIDDICENGILFETEKITQVVEKFRRAKIDALFTPPWYGVLEMSGLTPTKAEEEIRSAACSPAPR